MPADREEALVHEPGDEDGTTDDAEEVAEGPEEDELERGHGIGRAGRAEGGRPGSTRGREDSCARPLATGRSG